MDNDSVVALQTLRASQLKHQTLSYTHQMYTSVILGYIYSRQHLAHIVLLITLIEQ